MLRFTIRELENLPERVPKARGVHLAGETLDLDIGQKAAALLRGREEPHGSFVAALICIEAAQAPFRRLASAALDEALGRLSRRGVAAATLESGVTGGSAKMPYQAALWPGVLEAAGLRPAVRDTGGRFYRQIRFSPGEGSVEVARQPVDDAQWNPGKASLTLSDGARVFRDGHTVANATRFFREKETFRALEEVILPEHLAERPEVPFTLWSAACSSGAEAYSYAMHVHRTLRRLGGRCPLRVVGTDVNADLIEWARAGVYQLDKHDLADYRGYFEEYGRLEGAELTLSDSIRRFVSFRDFDLRQRPRRHRFRMVVCANVFQYYEETAREHFLGNLTAALEQPGYLYVGPLRSGTAARFGLEKLGNYGMWRLS